MVHNLCMKSHRVGPVAFLVPLILCSSLSAQTDQPFSVQVSGLALWTDEVSGSQGGWDPSVEGQIRWTGGAWSFGVGVQSTSTSRGEKETIPSSEGFVSVSLFSDYDASTLGFFIEPRFVVAVFADRFGLYVFSRVAVSRISEKESGTRLGETAPQEAEAYSIEGARTGLAAYVGPGLLVRLTSHVNLDLGLTAGFSSWGEPDPRVEPDFTGWNSSKSWYVLGGWVGLVIGIG